MCFCFNIFSIAQSSSPTVSAIEVYPDVAAKTICKISNGLVITAPLTPLLEGLAKLVGGLLAQLSGGAPLSPKILALLSKSQALTNFYVAGTVAFFTIFKLLKPILMLVLPLSPILLPVVYLLASVNGMVGGVLGMILGALSDLFNINPLVRAACAFV